MIELIKEKSIPFKDFKEKLKNANQPFTEAKISKYTSAVLSAKHSETELVLFLGLSNGNVGSLKVPKNKSYFQKFEDALIFPCKDEFRHKGSVTYMINEIIEGASILFTGGADSYIKIWNTDLVDSKMSYYTKTLFGHKGSIICLAYSKVKGFLCSSSTDKTIRIWKIDDNFVKVMNPVFTLFQTLKFIDKYKIVDEPFWVASFTVRENEEIELYAGDTQGGIHVYRYDEKSNLFVFLKLKKSHKNACIHLIHSVFDTTIYSISFDSHMIGYDFISNIKTIDLINNTNSFFSSLSLNNSAQELICGDASGNLSFIKIFNKTQIRIKAVNSKIFYAKNTEIYKNEEHVVVVSEDSLDIFKMKREMKTQKDHYHDDQVIKLFVIEPVKKDNIIVEDAKIISASFDNKIKIWDFLSMECICVVDVNENKTVQKLKKNVEIGTVSYLSHSKLIAIGLDIGIILFWDLNISDYNVNVDYHKYFKHKSNLTSMINSYILKQEKEKEVLFSAGYDGIILIWHIEAIEMKLNKTSNEVEKRDELDPKSEILPMSYLVSIDKASSKKKAKSLKEVKNYKYLPNIKLCINTSTILKSNFEIFSLCYIPKREILFSGGSDTNIYTWNIETGITQNYILKGHKDYITCLTYDLNFLFSGSADSTINIWNTIDFSLINTLNLGGASLCKIIDLVMLPQYGLMLSISDNKTINFLVYEKGELVKTINTKENLCCTVVVNSYGKLICGTKEKSIVEFDLGEIFDTLKFKHEFTKFPFLKHKENYTITQENPNSKINNFQVMNLITKELFDG